MKRFTILLSVACLLSCHKTPVEPQEIKATIIGYRPPPYTGCREGYELKTETGQLLLGSSFDLPAPYDNAGKLAYPALVWIRYKVREAGPTCSYASDLVNILSIRAQ
ncbi:hypothetical protein [Fibrella forsythiae]|uniref:DUF4377 domain-containing protein n=1 Tax=Fibrella forsythiae TaxID=2817061 RepID=A0ABS3JTE8_9BACT|nr:hypothetical protein [Fibrella forsythiae]MBO0953295.1 hypothetical protein [Fibrella forsythiae]